MLALGIVEKINSEYSVKVRIPVLHRASSDVNATPTDQLPDATICTFVNSYPNYEEGSVVVVGFDRNDLTSPIVLGNLLTEKENGSVGEMSLGFLTVIEKCQLPENTHVGSVSPYDIKCLEGSKVNLQKQIDDLEQRVSELES